MKTTTIPKITTTFGMEMRMKFQFRYVAGASNANYLDTFQVSGSRRRVDEPGFFRPPRPTTGIRLLSAGVDVEASGRCH